MARKVIEVETPQAETKEVKLTAAAKKKLRTRLDDLIPVYGSNKTEADRLKAVIEDDNKEIKAICKQLALDKAEIDGWEMTYRVDQKHNIDEDKMLAILKSYWTKKNGSMECPFIKTKEYIDQEALQNAIFNGDIADKKVLMELKACDTLIAQEKLFVKKAKEKKA